MKHALIEVAPGFSPWRVQAVRHHLVDHPLLQLESLVELGKRQEQRRLVRTHSDKTSAGSSFSDAPRQFPNEQGAAATLAGIAKAKAWMSLLNVQADPLYRALIDEVLDSVRPMVDPVDSGMCYRAGWIFVTSPGAITPFHMDHEHNFILQIRGTKSLYTWDPFDREVVLEEGVELFHDENSREKMVWQESFRDRAKVFALAPGEGGYMPSTTPHMVVNGDEPSITVSFTYYTNSTRRRELLFRGNAQLRRWGVVPRPVGKVPIVDTFKHAVLRGYTGVRTLIRRALRLATRRNDVRYAPT